MGSGALPRPIYTMSDARERWQEQTSKGTAEEKNHSGVWSLGALFMQDSPIRDSPSGGGTPQTSIATCCSSDKTTGISSLFVY